MLNFTTVWESNFGILTPSFAIQFLCKFAAPLRFPVCKILLMWCDCFAAEPRQLMDICRHTILSQMGKKQLNRVHELPLPMSVKNFVLYK